MRLEIVSPEGIAWQNDDVNSVILPLTTGQVQILAGHIPLIAKLDIGNLTVSYGTKIEDLAVDKGYALCSVVGWLLQPTVLPHSHHAGNGSQVGLRCSWTLTPGTHCVCIGSTSAYFFSADLNQLQQPHSTWETDVGRTLAVTQYFSSGGSPIFFGDTHISLLNRLRNKLFSVLLTSY